jgi:peptidoglycan/LPS O-acetylase OafA/YrhL
MDKTIRFNPFSRQGQMFLENDVVSYLGKISYGIYFFHPFVQKIYTQYMPIEKLTLYIELIPKLEFHTYLVHFVFPTLITVSIASISFELYEKRFLKLKDL